MAILCEGQKGQRKEEIEARKGDTLGAREAGRRLDTCTTLHAAVCGPPGKVPAALAGQRRLGRACRQGCKLAQARREAWAAPGGLDGTGSPEIVGSPPSLRAENLAEICAEHCGGVGTWLR